MNKTKIDWTDWSWNPVTGCQHGCPYCYARATARRWGRSPAEKTFEPMFHPERLDQVKEAHSGERVFVCSMADLFGKWVPRFWIEKVIHHAWARPEVIFQFLTKNPKRYLEFEMPQNFWLGATATNEVQWNAALDAFYKLRQRGINCPKRTHFISCEPLLSAVTPIYSDYQMVDWLIIGGCTGSQARQPEEAWVKRLEDWADTSGVPVFHKDNLECRRGRARKEFPLD